MIDRRAVLSAASVLAVPGFARAATRWEPRAAVPWTVQEVYGAALGDRIVIAGGMSPGAGGLGGGINPQERTGIYDPATDRWTEGPKLPFPRHHPVLAAARGRAYAFGGYRVTDAGGWAAIPDGLVLGADGWTAVAPMPKLQCETVAVTLGGRVHVASGRAPRARRTATGTTRATSPCIKSSTSAAADGLPPRRVPRPATAPRAQ